LIADPYDGNPRTLDPYDGEPSAPPNPDDAGAEPGEAGDAAGQPADQRDELTPRKRLANAPPLSRGALDRLLAVADSSDAQSAPMGPAPDEELGDPAPSLERASSALRQPGEATRDVAVTSRGEPSTRPGPDLDVNPAAEPGLVMEGDGGSDRPLALLAQPADQGIVFVGLPPSSETGLVVTAAYRGEPGTRPAPVVAGAEPGADGVALDGLGGSARPPAPLAQPAGEGAESRSDPPAEGFAAFVLWLGLPTVEGLAVDVLWLGLACCALPQLWGTTNWSRKAQPAPDDDDEAGDAAK
jgi:hypothetical protein